jgi:hypothetical protein
MIALLHYYMVWVVKMISRTALMTRKRGSARGYPWISFIGPKINLRSTLEEGLGAAPRREGGGGTCAAAAYDGGAAGG